MRGWKVVAAVGAILLLGLVGAGVYWRKAGAPRELLVISFVAEPRGDVLIPFGGCSANLVCKARSGGKELSYVVLNEDREDIPVALEEFLRRPDSQFREWFKKATGLRLEEKREL